jgi:hypothetical protein
MTLSQRVWIVGLFLAFLVFFMGFHSIDNAWNMRYVEDATGIDHVDCGMTKCFETNELYMNGLMEILLGCFAIFIMALFFPHGSEKRI